MKTSAVANDSLAFCRPQTWEPGALTQELERGIAPDPTQWGRFVADFADDATKCRTYLATMGGMSPESYDPERFLAGFLGLPPLLTPGRTNTDLLEHFRRLGDEYNPDPKFLPGPEWLTPHAQKLLLDLNERSPKLIDALDAAIMSPIARRMERADTLDEHPCGRIADIDPSKILDSSNLPKEQWYAGILRQRALQFPFGPDIHLGSSAGCPGEYTFGTADVCRGLGMSEEQAERVGRSSTAIDTNETHYMSPFHPAADRVSRVTRSGQGGKKGDLHRHYNRAAEGREDTRITAARVHLLRATAFAEKNMFQMAERELGYGLHSLQDMFSHAQISPFVHALLDRYPDLSRQHPLSAYEAAVATRAYVMKYLELIRLQVPRRLIVEQRQRTPGSHLVEGNAPADELEKLGAMVAELPQGLQEFLRQQGVQLYVMDADTSFTDLGFGLDFDGNGVIEVAYSPADAPPIREDLAPDGHPWDHPDRLAAYNHHTGQIAIRGQLLACDNPHEQLHHEIEHACATIISSDESLVGRDSRLASLMGAYIRNSCQAAQRRGEVPLDLSPAEAFAMTRR